MIPDQDPKSNIWRLVRGEDFLAYLRLHPKAIEYADYLQSRQYSSVDDFHNEFDFGFHVPDGPAPIDMIHKRLSELGEYDTGRECFIDQLASKLAIAGSGNPEGGIIFRTTDFKTNDLEALVGSKWLEKKETNPDMGMRGLVRYLLPAYEKLLRWELEACLIACRETNLRLCLLFPFVTSPSDLLNGLRHVLNSNLRPNNVGMMIEKPINIFNFSGFLSAITTHPLGVDGKAMFLFGLSDLKQFLLVAGRDNSMMSSKFSIVHPNIQRALAHVASQVADFWKTKGEKVALGLHRSTLSIINELDPDFAGYLDKTLSFLVEDEDIF